MRFQILGSSSHGNCALLQTPGKTVLIDAGFSGKRISEMLAKAGVTLGDLDGVFLTHEHSDHVAGLRGLTQKRPDLKIFCNRGTREAIRSKIQRPLSWQLFETGSTFGFGDIEVSTFMLPHDAMDPVGYYFQCGTGDDLFNPVRSLAWVTDLGYVTGNVTDRVRNADVLVLEANHDLELLEACERPFSTKQRIRGRHGHLSNNAAHDFLRETQRPGWKHVYLAHLSRECNDMSLVDRQFGPCVRGDGSCPITIVDPANGGAPAYEWAV